MAAALALAVFLGFFYRGVSEAAKNVDEPGLTTGGDALFTPGTADAALIAILTAAPLAATLVTALMIVTGSSMLPEEIEDGRMSMWLSLPQGRLRTYLLTGLAPFVLTYVLGLFLFGGILLITRFFFAFTPRSILQFPLYLFFWLCVVWAAVTTLSILTRKTVSMVITFFMVALATLFGGVYEMMRMFPGKAPDTLITITRTILFAFPADRSYRGLLHSIIPSDGIVSEDLAFFGVVSGVPVWHVFYALAWTVVVTILGYLAFRNRDF